MFCSSEPTLRAVQDARLRGEPKSVYVVADFGLRESEAFADAAEVIYEIVDGLDGSQLALVLGLEVGILQASLQALIME